MRFTPFVLLFAVGCASYKPAPFEPQKHADAWNARAANLGPALDCASATRLALLFNPALRQARAHEGVEQAGADNAGLLADPALSFGAGRYLSSDISSWIVSGGLMFSLPLSDRLNLEEKNAKQLLSVSSAQVLAQEAQTVREVRETFALYQGLVVRLEILKAQEQRLENLSAKLTRLVEAGSVAAFEADAVELAKTQAKANALEAQTLAHQTRLSLLALCGLKPDCPVVFANKTGMEDIPPSLLKNQKHPLLLCAEMAFESSESALALEVSKSYPELTLGPSILNDPSQGKPQAPTTLGINLGLTLPLWNRNKLAIAKAAAMREEARVGLEKTIELLANESAQAKQKVQGLQARLDILHSQAQPILERQSKNIERLMELGEFEPLRLVNVLEAKTQVELSQAQAESDLQQALAIEAYYSPESAANVF